MDHTNEAVGGSDTRPARLLDAPELQFRLAEELDRLRAEPEYSASGRSSMTLSRSGPLRVVLTAASAGTQIGGAPGSPGPLAVQVLQGRASYATDREPLEAGTLAWFGTGAPWAMHVDEEAGLLLTFPGEGDDPAGRQPSSEAARGTSNLG